MTTIEHAPWSPTQLVDSIDATVAAIPRAALPEKLSVALLHDAADFHLGFLEHHLSHALFPTCAPAPAFRFDASKRFVSSFVSSARASYGPPLTRPAKNDLVALSATPIHGPGGKPVFSQSALHGFHVFEGLQLRWTLDEASAAPRHGFAFREPKVAKLVDGIIRLRFAVHLFKAAASVQHLAAAGHADTDALQARYDSLAREQLPARREEAFHQTNAALDAFVEADKEELDAVAKGPDAASRFVYVRVEAQGGDRDAIGQGPIGVGQSTLQVLGQHAAADPRPAALVVNSHGPARAHTLAGAVTGGALHELLCNRAAHHGNMGHQHLSAGLAQPHGSDMLMRTCQIGADGAAAEAYVAESNFSNVAFVYDDGFVVFPESSSATYGLMQHELRAMLRRLVAQGGSKVGGVRFEPLRFEQFLADLRDGRVAAACVLGSMPALRGVDGVTVDESLSGGPIQRYALDASNEVLSEMAGHFQALVLDSVAWGG